MKRLIEKHQKSRGKLFSSEQAAKIESRLNPTKSVSDTTNEVTKQQKQKQRVSQQNTKEKVQLRKRKALSSKEVETHKQYEQAAQEAATDSWYNPRRIISNASSIPLVGLPFTIAKSLYGGMNYLLGNEGKAKYWWDSANQDAFGQNIALGAVAAHANPAGAVTGPMYDGMLLGDYVKQLDNKYNFLHKEQNPLQVIRDNFSPEDKLMTAVNLIPFIRFENPSLRTLQAPLGKQGTSGIPASQRSIIEYKLQTGRMSETDLAKLVGGTQAKWVFQNLKPLLAKHGSPGELRKFNKILDKAASGTKGKRGTNAAIEESEKVIRSNTLEGKYQLLRDKYLPILEKARERSKQLSNGKFTIDFDAESGGDFATMPLEFKMSSVVEPNGTIIDKRPFIQRYYENVAEWTKPGGLVDQVIKKGKLKVNEQTGQLEGLMDDGTWRPVNARHYIISQLPNYKASGTRQIQRIFREEGELSPTSQSGYYFDLPYHGSTTAVDKLMEQFKQPNKKGLFTVIVNGLPGVDKMQKYYTNNKQGPFIPIHRKIEKYETEPMNSEGGGSNSNDYGIYGSLRNHFDTHKGKASEVQRVGDPTGAGAVDEYDFGVGTPDIKSLWNTGDYTPGGSPFAYIEQLKDSNYA